MCYHIGITHDHLDMIVKKGSKECVVSEKTKRSFGCYGTVKEAKHRLAQVEYFKHAKGGAAKKKAVKK